jgi:hypothetical protein
VPLVLTKEMFPKNQTADLKTKKTPAFLLLLALRFAGLRLTWDRVSMRAKIGPKDLFEQVTADPDQAAVIDLYKADLVKIVRWEHDRRMPIEAAMDEDDLDAALFIQTFDGRRIHEGYQPVPFKRVMDGVSYARMLRGDVYLGPAWFGWSRAMEEIKQLRADFGWVTAGREEER